MDDSNFICEHPNLFHRLTLDAGSTGHIILELCLQCYEKQDKRFVINDEILKDNRIFSQSSNFLSHHNNQEKHDE